MSKIIKIPGRSGYYIRVAVPRGILRELYGTCDVVKKLGNTRKEAQKNFDSVEKEIQSKFTRRLMNQPKDSNDISHQPISTNSDKQFDDSKLSPCIANKSERSKFEQFKYESDYLKEPLKLELANQSDHFTNDAVQLLKFHGSYQQDDREHKKKGGEGKDWQLMLRLRNPGGYVPGPLFVALNELSERLGNKTLRATTRQCFQMHGIKKENITEVIGTIIKSMGSTLGACGDINRNVMAPAAPYERRDYAIARNLSYEIADLLAPKEAERTYLDLWVDGELKYKLKPSKKVRAAQREQVKGALFSGYQKEPLYGKTYMPRKFKCAVTVPGDNSVDLLTNDIGLVVFTSKSGKLEGCNVYIGGGMGRTHNLESTFARKADPLGYVDGKNILELVQSILAVQRDYGDRKTRRHSRMKYLIEDMGIDWFRNKLQSYYFSHPIKALKDEPTPILQDYLGWHQQRKGIWFVGIPILSGRLNSDLKKGMANIVDKYKLDLRLTPNQDILLCNIGNHQKASIKKELKNIGIDDPSKTGKLERHALACPALPLCGLAMTEAERTLPSLLDRVTLLLDSLNITSPILIRVTGCPNGCSRPYMAELALVGSGLNQYQLWLGGTNNLQRVAKPYLQRMQIDKLEETLTPLLIDWKKNGKGKSLGEYVYETGEESIHNLLSVTTIP